MHKYKIFLVVFCFLLSGSAGFAQSDKRVARKMEKAAQKKLQEEEEAVRKAEILNLVKEQQFVIENTTIRGKYSFQQQVSPSTNFIKIDGNEVVVQTAGGFHPGYNGLGGITIDGTITDYEILSNDDGNISLFIHFMSPLLGSSTLNIDIGSDGYAFARVADNWGGKATFRGRIYSLEETRVFEGQSFIEPIPSCASLPEASSVLFRIG